MKLLFGSCSSFMTRALWFNFWRFSSLQDVELSVRKKSEIYCFQPKKLCFLLKLQHFHVDFSHIEIAACLPAIWNPTQWINYFFELKYYNTRMIYECFSFLHNFSRHPRKKGHSQSVSRRRELYVDSSFYRVRLSILIWLIKKVQKSSVAFRVKSIYLRGSHAWNLWLMALGAWRKHRRWKGLRS